MPLNRPLARSDIPASVLPDECAMAWLQAIGSYAGQTQIRAKIRISGAHTVRFC
jgi:hypothetical protein